MASMTSLESTEGTPIRSSARIHGLDAYRGVLMMLGVVIHVAMVFIPREWGGWSNYSLTWESYGVWWAANTVHAFRMPAFFVLAGFFAALLWQRHGPRGMLENRFERLVLPFAVFVVFLPPVVHASRGFINTVNAGTGSPWASAWGALKEQPFLPDSTMHLWFVYDLIFIIIAGALVLSLLRRLNLSWPGLLGFLRRSVEGPWRSLLVFGLANALWCLSLEWTSIPTTDRWSSDPWILSYYFIIYGIGWMLFTAETDVEKLQSRAWTLTLIGLFCTGLHAGAGVSLIGFDEQEGVTPPPEILAAQVTQMVCSSIALVSLSRGLGGLFLRYAGSGSPRWRYLSDSSYWVYLIHLPLSCFVCAIMAHWSLPVLIKFPLGIAGVTVLCLLSYDVGVRATAMGRFLNGRKYPAARWKFSAGALALSMGCMAVAPLGAGSQGRASAWRDKGLAQELLADEDVIDPLHETPPVLPDIDLSRCIGVRNYAICPDGEEYNDSIVACQALGGSLASFETEEENTVVVELVHRLLSEPLRVGVTDEAEDGRWMWLTGVELNYDSWDKGQPDNHGGKESCAGINFFGERTWHDVPCDYEIGFVCEFAGK